MRRIAVSVGKLDLYSLTHDIFSTLHEAAEKQEVHMYMEGGSTVLDTVSTIMEEVLYNVCDNAVKYTAGVERSL